MYQEDEYDFDPTQRKQSTPDPQDFAPQQNVVSPWDRTGFRDAWLGTGRDLGAQDALIKKYGLSLSDNGTATLPSGEIMDLRRGAKAGDNTAQWMGVGEMHNGQATYYAPQAASSAASSPFGNDPELAAAFRSSLLNAMNGANAPFDPNDPRIAAQQGAFNAQRDRAAQQERAAMAERAAFNGLNAGGAGSGAFDTGLQGILENAGQDKAGFTAHLMDQDYQDKRGQLSHALDLANAVGARQEAAALQMQLANLDNQYRYAALGQNESQFEDTQAFNWQNWLTNQNRLNLLAGMGG